MVEGRRWREARATRSKIGVPEDVKRMLIWFAGCKAPYIAMMDIGKVKVWRKDGDLLSSSSRCFETKFLSWINNLTNPLDYFFSHFFIIPPEVTHWALKQRPPLDLTSGGEIAEGRHKSVYTYVYIIGADLGAGGENKKRAKEIKWTQLKHIQS